MLCGREIRLRRVKSLRRRGDLFHFTFRISGKFHNVWRTLFHIRHMPNISLIKYSCRFNSTLEFCNIIFFVTSLQKSRMRKRSGFLLFSVVPPICWIFTICAVKCENIRLWSAQHNNLIVKTWNTNPLRCASSERKSFSGIFQFFGCSSLKNSNSNPAWSLTNSRKTLFSQEKR